MNNLFLYIIGAVPNGPVKIGVSNNVEKRLLALQTGFHLTLSVIKKWKVQAAGAYRIEKLSHIQLHEHRLQGEWFSCSSKDAIKEIELILVTTKKGKDFSKDRKSTRLNSSHITRSRMPSSA